MCNVCRVNVLTPLRSLRTSLYVSGKERNCCDCGGTQRHNCTRERERGILNQWHMAVPSLFDIAVNAVAQSAPDALTQPGLLRSLGERPATALFLRLYSSKRLTADLVAAFKDADFEALAEPLRSFDPSRIPASPTIPCRPLR